MKGHQRASFCLIGKFTIKKNSISFWELLFEKTISYFSSNHLETGHFSNQGIVDDKPHLQSNDAQWKIISFQRIAHSFIAPTMKFS